MTHQRDLLLHPVRLRIVQALVGQPMTPLAIKAQLGDVAQATLYRQINHLLEGNLIQVVHERRIRGSVERTYAIVEDAVHLSEDQLEGATADDHFRYFVTFLGTLLADFGAYLAPDDFDLAADRVGYRQIALWLTDTEFDEMAGELSEAMRSRFGQEQSPGRKRRLVSTIVMPGNPSEDAES